MAKKDLRLRFGDFNHRIKSFKSEIVDLTVTSPPYDNLRSYKKSLDWNIDVFKEMVSELYRVTKEGGVVVWVVADQTVKGSESGSSFVQALGFIEAGFNLHDTMIYHKDNPPPVGGDTRYYHAWEYMFVFSKGKPKTFNPKIVPRRNKHNDKRTKRNKPLVRDVDGNFTKREVTINENVKAQNIFSYTVGLNNTSLDKDAFKHPAIMPEHLAYDMILTYSNEGDLVLEPMAGSGTVPKMAILTNRRTLAFERVREYYELTLDRTSRYLEHMREGICSHGGFLVRERGENNKYKRNLCEYCYWRLAKD